MKQPYLAAGIVVLGVLIIVGVFLYIQQSSSFMSQINQATSSMLGSSSASSATTTTTSTQTVPISSKSVTTIIRTSSAAPSAPVAVGTRPVISEFEPPAGTVGSTITIVGTGFDYSTNYISFGTSQDLHYSSSGLADNVIATVASSDGKTLSFTVPSSTASGLLCNSINKCSGISGKKIAPGVYPITVSNRNGISAERTFTVTAQ